MAQRAAAHLQREVRLVRPVIARVLQRRAATHFAQAATQRVAAVLATDAVLVKQQFAARLPVIEPVIRREASSAAVALRPPVEQVARVNRRLVEQ